MAIKDSTETWVRGKPIAAIVLVAAIGLVIGGVIGLGAGYKIEQSRTRSDVKALKAELKAGGSSGAVATGPLKQRTGKVKSVTGTTIAVTTLTSGAQDILTGADTKFETASAGKVSDIAVGQRVLVTIDGKDVIILPSTSKLGRAVSNVASDSFQILKPDGGKGAKLLTANVVHVYKLSPSALSDVKAGSSVLAGGRAAAKGTFSAVEVISLPADSGFVG